ncbi:MAG: RluA family pseudouridine synthase [Peptostreptococcaceae bacterium]|nr:RluA family pseudouridine synthase [Peptostreptococcaceae bacterium]
MEMIRMVVEANGEGRRLDTYLNENLEEFSRNYIQKLISEGNVIQNGEKTLKKNHRLKAGVVLELTIPEPEKLQVEAEDIPLDIVYEDEWLLVINKSKGMVVHPAPGNYNGTIVNALLYHSDTLSSINGVIRPGIVHRIDKDTTGLLVVAKNDMVHRNLAKQLKEHGISRIYYALVEGKVSEKSGTIDAPIGRDPSNRLKMAVVEKGKPSITHFEVLRRFEGATLLKCKLETGRTHQIRVHMAYIGHPIIGDSSYGYKKQKHAFERQALHAKSLTFFHPVEKRDVTFTCPMAEDMKELIKKMKARD